MLQISSPNPPLDRQTAARPDKTDGKVIIIDDEASLRRVLHATLLGLGFDVGEASSGDQAIQLCRIVRYDAALLDINMPGKSGIETCALLRKMMPRLAILMLSVNGDPELKAKALEAGADDYVNKPFHMRELTARIRATLRRTRNAEDLREQIIVVGELSLDPARRLVQKAGVAIYLTPKEFGLLHYLMARRGRPVTHARLLQDVWGIEYIGQVEYLRSLVYQLRRKLGDDVGKPRYLLTDSHVGYRFADPAE